MLNLFKGKGQLGIDFGSTIKIAEFDGENFRTKEYKELDKGILKEFGPSTKSTIGAVSSTDIKVKFIKPPKGLSPKGLKEMVGLQFEGDDQMIQYEWVECFKEKYIIAVGVPRDKVDERYRRVKELRLKPNVIETEFHANLRYLYNHFTNLMGVVSLIDIGKNKTDLIIAKDGQLAFLRSFDFAGGHITKKLARMNKISIEEAEEYKMKGIDRMELKIVLEELGSQIYSTIDFFQSEYKARVAKIFLTGGSSEFIGLRTYLENKLGIDIEKVEDNLFSVAKGLALRE